MKKDIILNETPIRTTNNFGINNIKIENFEMLEIKAFSNVKIENYKIQDINESLNIKNNKENLASKNLLTQNIKYGLGELFTNQIIENSNVNIEINISKNIENPIIINLDLDEKNNVLVDYIKIKAMENTSADITIIYKSEEKIKGYHNGLCQIESKENANIHVTIINLVNNNTTNLYSVDTKLDKNSDTTVTMVEFGGKYDVVNYYANIEGDNAKNKLHSIYLGKEEQKIDLNYIAELYGEKTNIDIEVNGALKDKAKKNFKGTIDFKTGCKKAKGKENEYCILLSDTSYSKALPMLLCTEDDVEGEHSTATGKIDEEELFYLMSRGINDNDAKKIIVKAKFNSIIEEIKNEDIRKLIIKEVDRRLD